MFLRLLIISLCLSAGLIGKPYKAVIFDFEGVLTAQPNRELVVNYIQYTFDLTKQEFQELFEKRRAAFQEGQTDEEFWLAYAKTRKIKLPSNWFQSFKKINRKAIGVNPRMYALIEELRQQKITVGLLSNVEERMGKYLREFGLYEPFEPCLLSWEIGMVKPDPDIYAHLLEQLNLPANNVIFIDDLPENVEAARQMGIDAILFKSEDQLRKALKRRKIL